MKSSVFKTAKAIAALICLSSCASGVISGYDGGYVITYFMTKDDVLEILGKPEKTLEIVGSDSYKKEGCGGKKLELLQYQSDLGDQYTLIVINDQNIVCKKLFKNQRAVWN
jgi:hypothetical protein